ncbi:MAG TPA: ABC transporter ATP-binding protein [Candidatus Binatia bacterium]
MHLQIRRLSKAYGTAWALRDIDLELGSGECVALLGPNGAGKTTLIKTLAGLIRPTSGEILVEGVKRSGDTARRNGIGILTPGDHLYEQLTAEENLKLFLALYGARKHAAITDELARAGLADWAREYVGAFSNGMKCRLSIAKWRLLDPRLLLVDEPYGVLDGAGVKLLESYLADVCRSGGVVVIATHDVARAAALCSRAVILKRGRVAFDEAKRASWESFFSAVGEFAPRGEAWPS